MKKVIAVFVSVLVVVGVHATLSDAHVGTGEWAIRLTGGQDNGQMKTAYAHTQAPHARDKKKNPVSLGFFCHNDKVRFELSSDSIYRAKFVARFSRITVTLICPGYCISS